MCKLKELTNEQIEKLPFEKVEETVFASKVNNCKAGKLCDPVDFFEQIEKCDLCGKLI